MVQFFTSILFSHLFKMDQGASELSKRNVFYNNFVGLADSSAELLNILNFLKSLLPDYCGVHNMVNSAFRSRNPSYKLYYVKHVNDSNNKEQKEDEYLSIAGFKEEKKGVWYSSYWSKNDADFIIQIFEFIDMIDWTKDEISFYAFDGNRYVRNYLAQKITGTTMAFRQPDYFLEQYMMDLSSALDLEIKISQEIYADSLKPCHAQIVYDNWPYSSETTVENIADDIVQLPTAGVFLKKDNQLVSWVMNLSPFGISRLHTFEDHRRRGYARIAIDFLSKKMAEADFIPISNVVLENEASKTLFTQNSKFKYAKRIEICSILPKSF